MARNVSKNKTVVAQPNAAIQSVQEGSDAAGASASAQAKLEGGEEKLQNPQGLEHGFGESANGKAGSGLDSENKEESNGEEGSENGGVLVLQVKTTQCESEETLEKMNQIAKGVFEKNSECKVLYFTVDFVPFFVESDAFRHGANTLKNDIVVTVKRV